MKFIRTEFRADMINVNFWKKLSKFIWEHCRVSSQLANLCFSFADITLSIFLLLFLLYVLSTKMSQQECVLSHLESLGHKEALNIKFFDQSQHQLLIVGAVKTCQIEK